MTQPIPKMRDENTLENGATLLTQKGNYVLAIWEGEYVTWFVDSQGHTHHGNYFPFRTKERRLSPTTQEEAGQAAWRNLAQRAREAA